MMYVHNIAVHRDIFNVPPPHICTSHPHLMPPPPLEGGTPILKTFGAHQKF